MRARDRLIDRILDRLVLVSGDVDDLHAAAALFNGLNRTDLHALRLLRAGGMTAGSLARRLHVTSGATTRVIDTLAAAGYVVRAPDPADRRRVLVQLTPAAQRAVDRTFEPLRAGARTLLEGYRDDELATVARLTGEVRGLLGAHARRLSMPDDR